MSYAYSDSRLIGLLVFLGIVMVFLAPLLSITANASEPQAAVAVNVSFTGVSDNGWRVRIRVRISNTTYECGGWVKPNPLFEELRLISKQVSVVSLYYVISSECPSVVDAIDRVKDGYVAVSISVPQGCILRTGLDWGGFGSLGGPYRIDARMFQKYYIYSWIVLVCDPNYVVRDYPMSGLSIILPAYMQNLSKMLASDLRCGLALLDRILGSTPLRVHVILVVDDSVFPLLPSDTGLSTGQVIVIKVSRSVLLDTLRLLIFHELAHSWFINGLLYGDPVFQEGVVQFFAWLAAYRCLGPTAAWKVIKLSEGAYKSYLVLHLALYNASRYACNVNVYLLALKKLYKESLKRSGGLLVSFQDLVETVKSIAFQRGCLARLENLYGRFIFEPGVKPFSGMIGVWLLLLLVLLIVFCVLLK